MLFRDEALMNFAENLVKLFREFQKNDRYAVYNYWANQGG